MRVKDQVPISAVLDWLIFKLEYAIGSDLLMVFMFNQRLTGVLQ